MDRTHVASLFTPYVLGYMKDSQHFAHAAVLVEDLLSELTSPTMTAKNADSISSRPTSSTSKPATPRTTRAAHMLLAPSGVASVRTRDVQLVQSSHGLGITWRQHKKDQKKKKGSGKKGDIYAYKVTVRRPMLSLVKSKSAISWCV